MRDAASRTAIPTTAPVSPSSGTWCCPSTTSGRTCPGLRRPRSRSSAASRTAPLYLCSTLPSTRAWAWSGSASSCRERKTFSRPTCSVRSSTSSTTTIDPEADRFARTLEQGMEQFEKIESRGGKAISGADAFRLHDTFGFPLELTRELAAERGVEVDEEGFRSEMAGQRERSRHAVTHGWALAKDIPKSEFTGYQELTSETRVAGIRRSG